MNSKKRVTTEQEIYLGRNAFPHGHSHRGDNGNWNLLLPISGECCLSIGSGQMMLESRTLYVIPPGQLRRFTVSGSWDCFWLHFNMEGRVQIQPEWPEAIPGVRAVVLTEDDFRKCFAVLEELYEVCSIRRHGWYILAYCLIQELILRGNMCCSSAFDNDEAKKIASLLDNLGDEPTIGEIATKCAMSRTGFFNKFKTTFGTTPAKYREQRLMMQVQSYLENTDLTVKEIAMKLNCENQFYLSARFKKFYGISPTEYRKKFRG